MVAIGWYIYVPFAVVVFLAFVHVLYKTLQVMVNKREVRRTPGLVVLYASININLLCTSIVLVFVYADLETLTPLRIAFDTGMHTTLRLTLYLTLLRFINSMKLLEINTCIKNVLLIACSLALTIDLIGLAVSMVMISNANVKDAFYIWSSVLSLTMLIVVIGLFTILWRINMKTWYCQYNRLFTAFVLSEMIGQILNMLTALLWHILFPWGIVPVIILWVTFAELLPALFIITMIAPKDLKAQSLAKAGAYQLPKTTK